MDMVNEKQIKTIKEQIDGLVSGILEGYPEEDRPKVTVTVV